MDSSSQSRECFNNSGVVAIHEPREIPDPFVEEQVSQHNTVRSMEPSPKSGRGKKSGELAYAE